MLELLFPVGGQAAYLMTIPNNPTLHGFSFTAQSVAFVTGANAQGLITSNGVQLTVGI